MNIRTLATITLACTIGGCFGDETTTTDPETVKAELSTEALSMAVVQQNPCVWTEEELGGVVFPGRDASVDNRTRQVQCYYTVNGGLGDDGNGDIALVTVMADGHDPDEYEKFSELYGEKPAQGFDIRTNISSLHKPGEQHAYVAYPKQGSVTVVVKSNDLDQEQLDSLARGLVSNLGMRLNSAS